ncbi:MAG: PilZ domain-containing protein [Sphingomicrobium sp.]
MAELSARPFCRKPILKRRWLKMALAWRTKVASSFFLDGAMVARSEQRSIDERGEIRSSSTSSTAVLEFRGRKHVVRLVNVSPSGAMVIFPYIPNIGERLPLQILDRGAVSAQVRWVRDGRIGLSFAAPLD